MANKKLIALEQLQTLTRKLYEKLHGEVGTVAAAAQKNLGDISALGTRMTDAEGKLDTIQGEGAGSIKKALADAKAYADEKDGALHNTITEEVNGVKSALDAEIAKKANSADMKTQLDAKADAADLTAEVNRATGAEEALAGRLDTIEGEGEGSVKKALADAKKYADDGFVKNGDFNALQTRVGTAESDIDALETAVGTDEHGNLVKVADRISAVNTAAGELAGRVTQAEKDIDAIEKDYLKAADKTALEGKITTAKEQADKGVADAAKAQATANDAKGKIDAFLKDATINGAVVDTLKEIQDYVTSDGAAADKMVQDIASKVAQTDYDAKVKELEDADTALGERAGALETLVGKKAQGDQAATGLVKEIADNKAGIAANAKDIAGLKKAVGQVTEVAAKSALDAVEGRVTTAEGKVTKLETAVGKPAVDGGAAATGLYKAVADEAKRAEGVEAGLDGRVGALETTVGSAASGLVKDVDDLQAAVEALEGTDHSHENKATLDAITATVKQGYDNAVAKVTGDAATEGTIANAKKAGTDAKNAVDALTITATNVEVDGVVTGVTVALGNGKSAQIDYPYEFVTDADIDSIIAGLGKQA